MAGLSTKRLSIGLLATLAMVLAGLDVGHAQHGPERASAARHDRGRRRPLVSGCTRRGPEVISRGPAHGNRMALTFDDGPKRWTTPILRELNAAHARATFFEEGRHVAGNQVLMRKILSSRDEIGNHSTWHLPDPSASDLARTNHLIRRATGFEPCLFRPPYGLLTPKVVAGAERDGLQTILWTVDSKDEKDPGARVIYDNVIRAASPGAIVLMHDGGADRSQTVAAVPKIVRALRRRGYRLVTLATLLGERMRKA